MCASGNFRPPDESHDASAATHPRLASPAYFPAQESSERIQTFGFVFAVDALTPRGPSFGRSPTRQPG